MPFKALQYPDDETSSEADEESQAEGEFGHACPQAIRVSAS